MLPVMLVFRGVKWPKRRCSPLDSSRLGSCDDPRRPSDTRAGDGTHAHAGADNRVLIVEDLEADGDILGFFGALDSPTATGPTLDTYICVRTGREVDRPTTSLLTRALHGWLSGPAAAAAATRRDRLGALAGAEEAGRPANEEEEGELVDWVDTRGRVICALPRPVVHSNNVLHRGAGVMIRDAKARTACVGQNLLVVPPTRKRASPSANTITAGRPHHIRAHLRPPLICPPSTSTFH